MGSAAAVRAQPPERAALGAKPPRREVTGSRRPALRSQRQKIEMLFAHPKRILRLDRLRLRGPNGARDESHLAATMQVPKPV